MTKQDAPTTTDAERAEFEAAWMARNLPKPSRSSEPGYTDTYELAIAQNGWVMWQAARASSAAAQPGWVFVPIDPSNEMVSAGDSEFAHGSANVWNAMLNAAPQAATSAAGGATGETETLLDAADEWANYVIEDRAPMTLRKYLERALAAPKGDSNG